ncbi:MAG: hypothetical protein LKU_00342 [Lactobacillus kefiranofaciens]|uniref:Uncharacterized protein n=1 Tax=Lactobacillus kefiranofaciens TaxID=267818 RepID=A0ABY0M9Q9_9LACO|nr:hypothetical protein [Lactobacillus kefiranofaciens]KRL30403.1 hypothetical protein FC94_GL001082 [Lactobacillus kefiranofaciens subsp. kefirgranum DSM 10550 = JCM 8572]KRM22833.1 hypothetical protein FC93_GL000769 [Lactobacillus kefiranofaciens subsp. kefiranofaciens DSM 5016 = JCM 6985]MCJ2171673.1 hypothetical protein [Lactobacillus kefiranofaciens]MCP9330332.1 hypothetical protein [Lactobacillus kefiranofaciens]MDF4143122.1 hypothetical protein [Lactobacillus kefiranofaciens]
MRLVPVKQAMNLLKKMCSTKNKYQEIKLLTAKKDRAITVKNDGSELTLIEDGYLHFTQKYPLTDPECRHYVNAAFKKEFPRSQRAYLVTVPNIVNKY